MSEIPMHHLVTGAAGFIGSHLVGKLLAEGNRVSALDDFSLGRQDYLSPYIDDEAFRLSKVDLRQTDEAIQAFEEMANWAGIPCVVWHLAANSDIPAGVADSAVDFGRTFLTTKSVLDGMSHIDAQHLAFASTSAVYGEHSDTLSESTGPLIPTSNYGAAKLASEAFISAAAETKLNKAWIFRFPNVVGRHATHGVIYDLIHRLRGNPESLKVLGDGTQAKPYLHISELIGAISFIVARSAGKRNIYNIGPDGQSTSVKFIAETVIKRVCDTRCIPIAYTGGDRGWPGDVPRFQFCTDRLAKLGWRPQLTSNQAIEKAVDEIATEILGDAYGSPQRELD